MANRHHVELVKQGAEAIRAWRQQNPDVRLDLSRANLARRDLHLADLEKADFRAANLKKVNLRGAYLYWCDLSEANLTGADLVRANLDGANLNRAILVDCACGATIFADNNLSNVHGLDKVRHLGPSTVGVDTLCKSNGRIPDAFLRGCGVDPRIQLIVLGDKQALTDAAYAAHGGGGPVQIQSCFVSYSSKDNAFVNRLQKALNESGVDYWYAPEHATWGQLLTGQIDKEITIRDRVILVCSNSSLNESDWVLHEITAAVETEKRRRADGATSWRVLFPVMIDDQLMRWNNPLRPRLLEVLAGDFRGKTKGKAFATAFQRLLKGLRKQGAVRDP